MIHLEDAQSVGEFSLAQREGVESGTEDHVLPDPGADRLPQPVLGIADAQDVLGVYRPKHLQQAMHDQSVQEPVGGDQAPERRGHLQRVVVGKDRWAVPAQVTGANRRYQHRRSARPQIAPVAPSSALLPVVSHRTRTVTG